MRARPLPSTLSLVLLLAACGNADPVLGKWTEIGKTEFIEFFKDGTVTVADPRMHVATSGTYSADRETYLLKTLYSSDGSTAGSYRR